MSKSDTSDNDKNPGEKLWGGRFSESTDAFVEQFTASVTFDQRLYRQDIEGSVAHARMLGRAGVLTPEDVSAIEQGLESVQQDIEAGNFVWSVSNEDVHMNIEAALTAKIGDAGKRLHTGRSRNDQVATDIRLYLRHECVEIANEMKRLGDGMIALAEQHADTVMPGFTHLQSAQPVTFGHHLLAWFEMILRDLERLADSQKRINTLPLGAAALAGTSFPIDRDFTRQELGFDRVCENSLDAVSDRDFAIEFCSTSAICLMHLSRMAEELILWTSAQFRFIELPDRFCTGSSIMPQKKNPDVPELVRGKSSRTFGNLMSMLTLMKSQPLAYNKDNQEDKEPLFDSVDTLKGCLRAFADMIPAIVANKAVMETAARAGFSTATDLADYLVRKGVAFRDAHEVVGSAVKVCSDKGCDLADLTLEELQGFSSTITQDVFNVLTIQGSVQARDHIGGTAPSEVKAAAARARQRLIATFQTFA
ncbi:MAG: argininosuccinate lyase [Gammaproteobacteria bacterium]|nr:argininosuccinate lyase [Gammaproteobacteria bacterium]